MVGFPRNPLANQQRLSSRFASQGKDPFKQKRALAEILTACRFYVELTLEGSQDGVDGLFMECKGFKVAQEVVEFNEVYPEPWGRAKRGMLYTSKIPGGNTSVDNISLRRGVSGSETLWNWVNSVHSGNWSKQRRNGSITIYRQNGEIGALFQFEGAWPISYSVTDNAASSSELACEELEIACEVFKRIPPP
ncbi:phage tail protein [Roseofilum casamattae]|uniref:Phage tail protein n=1 Tax=Roseofilum casamattae BLCC-M143 TaxID=3022442 RepID=A0ABT7BX49_9CYAN|nr:phage tail protein [Roseofilum casamattae]MDJ1183761.1 phage tail protein [Roseofilum casamattae BLCC-M143]